MPVLHFSPITSSGMQSTSHAGPQPERPQSTLKYKLLGISIIVLCIGIVLLLTFTLNRKKILSKQDIPTAAMCEATAPAVADAPVIRLDTVIIKSRWSLLAGMHPTVTLNATVQERGYRIRYCLFSYHLKNDSDWIYVDAVRKGKGYYSVKLRDLEKDAVYEYCLLAVHKDFVFSSSIHEFAIPK